MFFLHTKIWLPAFNVDGFQDPEVKIISHSLDYRKPSNVEVPPTFRIVDVSFVM